MGEWLGGSWPGSWADLVPAARLTAPYALTLALIAAYWLWRVAREARARWEPRVTWWAVPGLTLLLLAHAGWHWLQQQAEPSARFVQAALTGTGLFVVALLAHELARRLMREEALAHQVPAAARRSPRAGRQRAATRCSRPRAAPLAALPRRSASAASTWMSLRATSFSPRSS